MVIPLTKSQVMAAKLRLKIDRQRGVETPSLIRELAQAGMATPAESANWRAQKA